MRLSILVPFSAFAFIVPWVPTASALPPWAVAVDHPFPVSQAVALTGDDGLVYIFGGLSAGAALNTARAFDPSMDTYAPIATMPFATRGACGAVLDDGRIAIFGGFDSDWLDQTQLYDPVTDTWAVGTPQVGGWECAAAIDDAGLVHLIGGEAAPSGHSIYDPVADAWIVGPPSPNGRLNHGAVRGDDGLIYVFGGDLSPNTLDIFDPMTNLWSPGPVMPGSNQQFAWVTYEDEIYVIGGSTEYGNDSAPYFNTVWIYDIAAGSWMVDAEALVTGTREATAAIDSLGVVHVFGGSNGVPISTHQVSVVDNDLDDDGIDNPLDNCVGDPNPMQEDADMDGQGDVCDPCPNDADDDIDDDMVCGDVDNCPDDANEPQDDADADGLGDICDACPNDADNDIDGDMICGDVDNCPADANPDQADADGDGQGDACDLGDGTTGDMTTGTAGETVDGTADDTAGQSGESGTGGASAATDDTGIPPGPGTTTGDSGESGNSGNADGGVGDEGCACRAGPERSPAGGLAILALVGLWTRRRRR
ncbi:MAG: thrombospondin type 3 repeat-containing protein [Myxococcota bacterium]